MTQRTILYLGASALVYTEGPPEHMLRSLVEAELRVLAPHVEWRGEYAALHYAPNMLDRTGTMVERHRPDAVLLSPGGAQFLLHWSVSNHLRRLLGRAAPSTAAGGPADRRTPRLRRLRSALLLGPHLVASALIGAEPGVPVDQAVSQTEASIAALRSLDVAVVCRLSQRPAVGNARRQRRALRYQRSRLAAFCDANDAGWYDVEASLPDAGLAWAPAPDRMHLSLDCRRFEARIAAAALIHVLGVDAPATDEAVPPRK